MTEEWRPVVGYEGQYEVSNLGRVRSLDRVVEYRNGPRFRKGRLLTPYAGDYGHTYLKLGGRKSKRSLVHKLVFEAFVETIPAGCVVRHLDGDPQNNTPSNLALGTQADNLHDIYDYGGRAGGGKLYREQVLEIRDLLHRNVPVTEIAHRYRVTPTSVYNIKTGRTFSYIK